jgi:hypothetical protein
MGTKDLILISKTYLKATDADNLSCKKDVCTYIANYLLAVEIIKINLINNEPNNLRLNSS